MKRIFKRIALLASTLAATFLLFGCGNSEPSGPASNPSTASGTAQAAAPELTPQERWGIDEFVIVLLPGEDTPEVAWTREVFGEALGEVLGIPVREFHGTSYAAVIEAMRVGHAHAAHFGPFSYVTAVYRAGAEAFAIIGRPDPAAEGGFLKGYYSLFITHVDSGIYSMDDLPGRTFGFVDPESASGNIVPLNEFINYFTPTMPDLHQDDLHISGRFFSTSMFTGTHPNSIQGVLRQDIDAAAVASTVLTREVDTGLVDMSQLRIFHSSPLIPNSPLAFQRDLPDDLKELIKNFFFEWDDEEFWEHRGGIGARYIPISDSDFDVMRELRERFGLED
ncbi:MAG: phosphate/phosphite/phosphonate ABC transporter substrate-binding protein [Oscillospiraceae bacterium]|nr:phosphate/phosphite/phosphonate ABC transporter substrate-binding protein [Oscillospiraceae bacterium]